MLTTEARPQAPPALDRRPPPGRRRRTPPPLLLACAASIVPAVWLARWGQWTAADGQVHLALFDDAMISMSYARTLADGHGLVWFPGAERVEGITNLGWALIMAVIHRIGLDGDAAVMAVRAVGLVIVWCTAGAALALTRPAIPAAARTPTRALVPLAVVLNPPLLYWTAQGMEVALWTLLMLMTGALAWRIAARPAPAAIHLALVATIAAGVVTRPDFVIVPVALAAWAALARRARLRAVAAPLVLATAAALAATVAFRLHYYGDPLPNTYYLKVTGVPLPLRLSRGALTSLGAGIGFLGASAAVVVWCWQRLQDEERRVIGLLLALTGAIVAYNAWVGGDAFDAPLAPGRFITPAIVTAVLAAIASAVAVHGERPALLPRARRSALLAGLAALACLGPVTANALALVVTRRTGNLGLWAVPLRDALPGPLLVLALGTASISLVHAVATRRPLPALPTLAVLGACLVAGQFPGLRAHDGAGHFALLGSQLARVTTDEAVIAVVSAGSPQYVSGRRMVDLLGKSDRTIARGPAATPTFLPGHNKWNYPHSLAEPRPDVLAQLIVSGDEITHARDRGYVPVRLRGDTFRLAASYRGQWVVWVLPDSPHVRWDELVLADEAR